MAAMVGLDARSTMDLDATVKGAGVNIEDVENMMTEIVAVAIDDGVTFQVKNISEIMDEAEYPGIRVKMTTLFDGVRTPLKIDISTGDAITPKEVRYSFKLMLEDRSIDVWAYNLETVLAEKLETSPIMQDLWVAYQNKFAYASDLGWNTVLATVRKLYDFSCR